MRREPPLPLEWDCASCAALEAEIERLRALVERCANIAENPGFIQAQDTEWDEGVNYTKRFVAKAIRAALVDTKP